MWSTNEADAIVYRVEHSELAPRRSREALAVPYIDNVFYRSKGDAPSYCAHYETRKRWFCGGCGREHCHECPVNV